MSLQDSTNQERHPRFTEAHSCQSTCLTYYFFIFLCILDHPSKPQWNDKQEIKEETPLRSLYILMLTESGLFLKGPGKIITDLLQYKIS